MLSYSIFKIYFSNIQDLDQKKIINRIKLLKNKINKLNVILPIQKHTNKIFKLSKLFSIDLNYSNKLNFLEVGFDGIYFSKEELYLLNYFGIGVLTADCLPIIILVFENNLDNKILLNNKEVLSNFIIGGVLHAGWKGIFNGIIYNFFKILNSYINSFRILKIFIYIGPSIRKCCYEVKKDFIIKNNIPTEFLTITNNKIYLDLIDIVKKQIDNSTKNLEAKIEKLELIDKNECTYCSNKYFSYRKGHQLERNITVLYL